MGRSETEPSGKAAENPPLSRLNPTTLAILAAAAAGGHAPSVLAVEQKIETDGRTATQITENGDHTTITTSTVKDNAGFNSFSHFRVAKGNTVDLHLPGGTDTLVNLIHESKAVIDGTVSSLLSDGVVGGHVVFADPHGIVVGQSGTLNVGSLLLTTPTASFMDEVISPGGDIGEAAVERLLAGEAPQAADAEISVEGRINALSAIRVEGVDIDISGELYAATDEERKDLFEATVNTDGLTAGDFASVEDGSIVIGARSDTGGDTRVAVSGGLYAANDVTVSAQTTHEVLAGWADANAAVEISGQIGADNIEVSAETLARVDFDPPDFDPDLLEIDEYLDEAIDDVEDFFGLLTSQQLEDMLLGGALEVFGSAAVTTSDATVTITDGAHLHAFGDVDVEASAQRTIHRPPAPSLLENVGLGIAAGVQLGDTRAAIESGATVEADGDLAVNAGSDNSVTNQVEPSPLDSAPQDAVIAGIAVTHVDAGTEALVESGATVDAHDVTVDARTENSFNTGSKVGVGGGDGVAGISFALALVDTETRAELGADLDGVGDVAVIADTQTSTNQTTASATAKSPDKSDWEKIKGKVTDAAKDKVKDKAAGLGTKLMGKLPLIGDKVNVAEKDGDAEANKEETQSLAGKMAEKFRLGGAVSVAETRQTSEALIADGATIEADGDVAVLARLEDSGIRNRAESSVAAKTKQGNADVTTSAAVSYAGHTHTARAVIGDNVTLRAERLGVGSRVEMPLNLSDEAENLLNPGEVFTAIDSFSDFTDILGWFRDARDVPGDLAGNVFTSHVNSTGSAEDVAIAGSVNVFNVHQDSTAWIGDGADVRVSAPDEGWETVLAEAEGEDDDADVWAWSGPLSVMAQRRAASINVGGNFGWLKFFGTGDTPDEDGVGLGGAFQWSQYTGDAVAGIGGGAVIEAEAVDVEAESFQQIVSLAPSAGKADKAALNGTFAISRMRTGTRASIAASAQVSADRLSLSAQERVSVWTSAGAVGVSENVGVGAGVAVNDLVTESAAYVGDNRGDHPFVEDAEAGDAPSGGLLRVNTLSARALTSGQAGTFAVAGAAAVDSESDPDNPGLLERGKAAVNARIGALRDRAADLAGRIPLLNAATEEIRGQQGGGEELEDTSETADSQQSGASPDVAASGSAGVNLTRQDTRAMIGHVTIEARDEEVGVDTTLQALNDTLMLSTAGAGSLIKAGGDDSSFQAALAGSVALNVMNNDTGAGLEHVTLGEAGDTRIEALSAGDQVAVGLGLALNVSGGDTSDASLSAAGSASVNWSANTTSATVSDSTIEGFVAPEEEGENGEEENGDDENSNGENGEILAGPAVDVVALDRTRIATGGGSLLVGGKAGVGAAFTLSNIGNETRAALSGTTVEDVAEVSVRALNDNRIIAGGAVGAFSDQDNSYQLAGTLVFNLISNRIDAAIESSEASGARSVLDVDGDVRVVAADHDPSIEDDLDHLLALELSPEETDIDFAADIDADIADGSGADPDYEYNPPENAADIAASGSAIVGIAGVLQAGRANNVGVSVVTNTISNEFTARIDDARVTAGGDVRVDARDTAAVLGASMGASVTSGKFAGMGSVSGNILSGSAQARIEGGVGDAGHEAEIRARDLGVNAVSSGAILSFAGNISGSGKVAGGAAVTYNHTGGLGDDNEVSSALAAQTVARVAHADVELSGDAAIRGARQGRILSAALSGTGTGKVALGGALNASTQVDRTYAELVDSRIEAGDVSVEVGSADLPAAEIFGGSGQFGGAGKVSVGGAFTVSTIESKRDARIIDSDVIAEDRVRVGSDYNARIINVAAGGGGAGSVAAGGSLVAATIAGHSRARVQGSTVDAGRLEVETGGDSQDIISAAGNAQGAGTAAVGGAATTNVLLSERQALIEDSEITLGGDLDVFAGRSGSIFSLAAGAGGAGTAAVGGSVTVNVDESTLAAGIRASDINADVEDWSDRRNILVRATDEASVDSIAGQVQVGGTAAVGATASVNYIGNDIAAFIEGGSDATYRATNVHVDAQSDASIQTVALGATAAGTGAVTGSAAVNVMLTETSARIGRHAQYGGADGDPDVVARHNVGVTATSSDVVAVAAGVASFGLQGGAGSAGAVVNVLENRTHAGIDGSGTRVSALAHSSSDRLTVSNGLLPQQPALGPGNDEHLADEGDSFFADAGDHAEFVGDLEFNPVADLGSGTEEITGIAVRADSIQQVGTASTAVAAAVPRLETLGIAGFAGSVLAGTNVMAGETSAVVEGATLNDADHGARSRQNVSIGAASHTLSVDYALSGAVSTFTGAGVVAASVVARDTEAGLHDATVAAGNALDVFANATQQGTSVSLGAAFGAASAAGTMAAVALTGDTTAGIRDTHADVNAIGVDAQTTRTVNLHSGAVAAGAAAVGGSLTFGLVEGTTEAFIEGDRNGSTALDTDRGDVRVHADTDTTLFNNVAGFSGGAYSAAGSGAANVVTNTTLARVDGAQLGTDDSRIGGLDVHASDHVSAWTLSGAGAVGETAGGAAANVLVMQADLQARISDSRVHARGDVDIGADRSVDAYQMAATAGLGNTGLAGGLALAVLGSGNLVHVDEEGETRDPHDELDRDGEGTLTVFDDVLGADRLQGFEVDRQNPDGGDEEQVDLLGDVAGTGNDVLGGDRRDRVDGQVSHEASGYLDNGAGHQTTATISGSVVDVAGGNDVTVHADERLAMRQVTGAAAGGVSIGAGASAGMVFSWANVHASIDSASRVETGGGHVDVKATTGSLGNGAAVEVDSYTGAAGGGAGLGAAVAVASMNNSVSARVDGEVDARWNVDVTAADSLSLDLSANGAAVGVGGALGVVIAHAERESTVHAGVGSEPITAGLNLNVEAVSDGAVDAVGRAAAAGLPAAGTGVGVWAADDSDVTARVDAGAQIDATRSVSVEAVADPSITTEALGIAVSSGVSIGASVAGSRQTSSVLAEVGDGTSIAAGRELQVTARTGPEASDRGDDRTRVSAYARGAAGGALVGANATVATVATEADTRAQIGDDVSLPDGDVEVAAWRSVNQSAEATGFAAGLVAAGANLAFAESGGLTEAVLGRNAETAAGRTGDLVVRADGQDVNVTDVLAGSGGVASAHAAVSEITSDVETRAEIVGSGASLPALHAGSVRVIADHEDRFSGSVDSFQASVAGMSGAAAHSRFGHHVEAVVGDDLTFIAGDFRATAHRGITQIGDGNSVQGGSGGVASGSAVDHELSIGGLDGDGRGETHVRIGDDVSVIVNPLDGSSGQIELDANNTITVNDIVLLDTGGGISGARADTALDAMLSAEVDVGDDTLWRSPDRMEVAAWGRYQLRLSSRAKTYGGVSVVGGMAEIDLDVEESIRFGDDTDILAFGVVNLTAGGSPQGRWDSQFSVNANSRVYNYNFAPLDTDAEARSTFNHSGDVRIGRDSEITSARDVRIAAYDGNRNVTASARASNPYLDALSIVDGTANTQTSGSTAVTLSGHVEGGALAERILLIDEHGNVSASEGISFTVEDFVPADLVDSDDDDVSIADDEEKTGVRIAPIFAASGSVFVHADSIDVDGSAELVGRGGAEVHIENDSTLSLIIEGVEIGDRPGGFVRATGRAGFDGVSGLSTHAVGADLEPSVYIANTHDTAEPGADPTRPDIVLVGLINNPLGTFEVFNQSGDLLQGADVIGREVTTEVPNGSMIVSLLDGIWGAGGSAYAMWRSLENLPNNPNSSRDVENAVHLLANVYFPEHRTTVDLPAVGEIDIFDNRAILGNDSNDLSWHFFNWTSEINPGDYDWDTEEIKEANEKAGHDFRLWSGEDHLWVKSVQYKEIERSADAGDIPSTPGPTTVGGAIHIEAQYIDINGRLVSGDTSGVRKLEVTDSLIDLVTDAFDPDADGVYDVRWSRADTLNFQYDPKADEIRLYNIAPITGANISLKGGIISTNTHGALEVNNGFLEVDVVNETSSDLVVHNINTGGGEIASIRIEDTLQDNGHGDALITWYRSSPGANVEMRDNTNGAAMWDDARTVATGARNSGWDYSPKEGTRYQWSRIARIERESSCPGDSWWDCSLSNWRFVDGNGNTAQDNPWALEYAAVIHVDDPDAHDFFEQEITGGLRRNANDRRYRTINVDHGVDYGQGKDSEGEPKNWRYRAVLGGWLRSTASVRADSPIDVLFSGSGEADVSIESAGDVRLAGNIRNTVGRTSIDAGGAISIADDVSVQSKGVDLHAGGDIGSALRPVTLTLLESSFLNDNSADIVSEAGSVNVEFRDSDAIFDRIHAGMDRDVTVVASGNILGRWGGANSIRGRNINLTSTSGHVGVPDSPVRIDMRTEAPGQGLLNIDAAGDIGVNSFFDIVLGEVTAADGDVGIYSSRDVLDGLGIDNIGESLSSAELEEIWESMGLIGDGAEVSADRTVAAFETQVDSWYGEYWQLRHFAGEPDGSGAPELDEASRDLLRNRAAGFWRTQADAVANGRVDYTAEQEAVIAAQAAQLDGGGVPDSVVDTYVGFRMDDLAGRLEGVDGVDAESLLSGAFDANWSYEATAAVRDELTAGATGWTEKQLRNMVSLAALESAPATTLRDAPNVSGRNVEIIASGRIGEDIESERIEIGDGAFSEREQALLLTAGPGDVTEVIDSSGDVVALDVRRRNLVQVGALERVDLVSWGNIYVGSHDELRLGHVGPRDIPDDPWTDWGGDVRLLSGNGIHGIGDDIHIVVDGDRLDAEKSSQLHLSAGSGSITGGANGALAVHSVDSQYPDFPPAVQLPSATAGGDVRIAVPETSISLGQINAGGTTALSAKGGILPDSIDPGAGQRHIRTGSLELDVGRSAGSFSSWDGSATYLFVELAESGSVSGSVGNNAAIRAPSGQLTFDDFSVGEQFAALAEQGRIRITGAVDVGEGATLDALAGPIEFDANGELLATGGDVNIVGASLTMDPTSSIEARDGRVNIGAPGNLLLADVTGTADSTAGTGVVAQAGGFIRAAGDANRIRANGATARLMAANGIGQADRAVQVDGARTEAESDEGDIHLRFLQAGEGGDVAAHDGDVDLDDDGDGIRLDTITAAGDVTGEAIDGDVRFDTLTAGGDAALVTSGSVNGRVLDAGGWASIESASLELTQGHTDTTFDALTSGEQVYGSVHAGDTMTLVTTGNGAIRYASLTGDAGLSIDGAGDIEALVVDPDAEVTRGGAVFVDAIDIRGDAAMQYGLLRSETQDIRIEAAGHVAAERVRAPAGALWLEAHGARVDDGVVRDELRIDTTLDPSDTDPGDPRTMDPHDPHGWADRDAAATITFGDLESLGDSVLVFSGWDVEGGSADAEIDVILLGREVGFDRIETRQRDVDLRAVGSIVGQRVISARDIRIVAGEDLLLESADYDGDISLEAGRDIYVRIGGNIDMERIVAGRHAELFAGGYLSVISVDAGGVVTLEADEWLRVDDYIDAGEDVRVVGGEWVSLGNVSAGEAPQPGVGDTGELDALIRAGGTLDAGRIEVAGDVTLDALDDAHVVEVISDGWQSLAAGGDLVFERLAAGEEIRAEAAGEIRGASVFTPLSLEMTAGWTEGDGLSGRDLRVDEISAATTDLRAGHDIVARDGSPIVMEVVSESWFTGREIAAQMTQSGAGQLDFRVVGANGTFAEDVWLSIDSQAQLRGEDFHVEDAWVGTTSSRVRIDEARVGRVFTLESAELEMVVDNVDPGVRDVDVQLYEPDAPFWVRVDGEWLYTDAFVTHFRPGYQVTAPNLTSDRSLDRDADGRSAERDANRAVRDLSGMPTPEDALVEDYGGTGAQGVGWSLLYPEALAAVNLALARSRVDHEDEGEQVEVPDGEEAEDRDEAATGEDREVDERLGLR